MKRIGKPADRNFFLILKTSLSNEDAIFTGPVKFSRDSVTFYTSWYDHGVGNLFFLVKTFVEIIPSADIVEMSKNSLGLATAVSFTLG